MEKLFLILCFISQAAFAQGHHQGTLTGILPGEPNPNTSPQYDRDVTEEVLLDDRKPCPKGSQKYQKLVCGDEEKIPKCVKYHPLIECRKKPGKLNCSGNRKPVHIFVCDK